MRWAHPRWPRSDSGEGLPARLCLLFLLSVFGFSGLVKLWDPYPLSESLGRSFPLLPYSTRLRFAYSLATVEILTATGLLHPQTRANAVQCCITLTCGFAAHVVYGMLIDGTSWDCGCFGPVAVIDNPAVRAGIVILLAGAGVYRWRVHRLHPTPTGGV